MSAPLYPGTRHGVYGLTTDATQTVLATLTPPNPKCAFWVEAKVLALRTSNFTGAGAFWRRALFTVAEDGTVAQVGATETIGTDIETVAGWDVTIDVSSDVIRILVTGAAATNLSWLGDAYINEIGQYVANAGAITG